MTWHILERTQTDRPPGVPVYTGHYIKAHARYINAHLLTDCCSSWAQQDRVITCLCGLVCAYAIADSDLVCIRVKGIWEKRSKGTHALASTHNSHQHDCLWTRSLCALWEKVTAWQTCGRVVGEEGWEKGGEERWALMWILRRPLNRIVRTARH